MMPEPKRIRLHKTLLEKNHKNSQRCGLCAMTVVGGTEKLFNHSRLCLMKKISTIVCPCCPQTFFETKNAYSKHLGEQHRPQSHATRCVFCAQNLPTWADLLKHQGNCFPTLSLKAFNQCEYCNMGFFFPDVRNVFFFAHANKEHYAEIQNKWNEICTNCHFRYPNAIFLNQHFIVCIERQPEPSTAVVEKIETTPDLAIMMEQGMEEEEDADLEETVKDELIDIQHHHIADDSSNDEIITGDIG